MFTLEFQKSNTLKHSVGKRERTFTMCKIICVINFNTNSFSIYVHMSSHIIVLLTVGLHNRQLALTSMR